MPTEDNIFQNSSGDHSIPLPRVKISLEGFLGEPIGHVCTTIRVDRGCSQYGVREFVVPFWSVPFLKVSRSLCNSPITRKTFCVIFYDFGR